MTTKHETSGLFRTILAARKRTWALAAILLAQLPAFAAPVNDNFESATILPANWSVAHGNNTNATAQAGETTHSPTEAFGTKSVWWKWTPNFSGQVKITTENSGSTDIGGADPFNDTQLAVYTGTTLANLTPVAKNEDHTDFAHGWSRVNITVAAGTTYYIAVDSWEGFNGREGRIQLNLASLAGSTKFFITPAVIPPGAGTITLNPPQPGDGYLEGTVVNVTVTPVGTNVFWGWGGTVNGTGTTIPVTMNANQKAVAAFNANHAIYLQNSNTRQASAWLFNNTTFLGALLIKSGTAQSPGWAIFGNGDLNNDGFTDLLVQHTDGRVAVRYMQNSYWGTGHLLRSGKAMGVYRAFAVADIDGNGHEDILFSNGTDIRAWRMSGATFLTGGLVASGTAVGSGWRPAAAVDIDGNGSTDILFQHTDGRVRAWLMSGTTRTSELLLRGGAPAESGWRLFGAANLNGGGNDLIFQHSGGAFGVWYMTGTTFNSSALLRNGVAVNPAWQGKTAK